MSIPHKLGSVASLLVFAFACTEKDPDPNTTPEGAAGDSSESASGGRASGSGGATNAGHAGQTSQAGSGEQTGGSGDNDSASGGTADQGGAPDAAAGAPDAAAAGAPDGAAGAPNNPDGNNGDPGSDPTRFFLPTPTPDNTSAPSIEVDAKGGVHAVYPAYAGGNAYYAYCDANCSSRDAVKVVEFDTQGTVANAMLALTAQGKPRVLLSSFQKVYFASCDSNCTSQASWQLQEIMDHAGDREVSGEALALDSKGNPRFLMHTYRAYLGIGQKDPKTWYATCDGDCLEAASWTYSEIAQQIWEGTSLRFDAGDHPHIATNVDFNESDGDKAGTKLSAYLECNGDCTDKDAWNGIGFMKPYESETDAVSVRPTVSLALTSTGAPRVVVLGQSQDGKKNIIYFECDEDCTNDHWQGAVVSNHDRIGAGLDLALDANDRPRLAYTIDYNIGLAYCDMDHCGAPDSNWDLTKVELSSEMKPDEIFLWENCTVAAWFLHSPSVALTRDGKPRVGYQARDISGGWSQPDPTKPACTAGTDMTWSRLAVMPSYK